MPIEYAPVGDTSEFPVDTLDQPNLYSTFSSGEDSNDQHLHNIFGTVLDSLDAQEISDYDYKDEQNVIGDLVGDSWTTSFDYQPMPGSFEASESQSLSNFEDISSLDDTRVQTDSAVSATIIASEKVMVSPSRLVRKPSLKRRKSNPFYSPSKHIRNMMSRDRHKKFMPKERPVRSEQPSLNTKNNDDRPSLSRRQTVG